MRRYAQLWGLLLLMGVAASCGPEAPPREAGAGPQRAATPLLAAEAPQTAGRTPDPRAQGDPSAPIVVIEYGDYQ